MGCSARARWSLRQLITAFDPQRHLTRADVVMHRDRMVVVIKAAKNLQCFDQRRSATLYPAPDTNMCLMKAVRAVLRVSPTEAPHQTPPGIIRTRPVECSYRVSGTKGSEIYAPLFQEIGHISRV